jgi:hypothetical protein
MVKLPVLAMALAALPQPAFAQGAELPGWMAGCWEMRDGDRWAEECWTIPRGGQMIGSGRAGTGDEVRSFEHMRIERDETGTLAFLASPGGEGWTPFTAVAEAGEGVTFENAANDYPQRVRYWREGELLKAEILRKDGSRAMSWTFRRMGG